MVKSWCVKERKQTECVPGTERYVKTKNNRTMMKCKCASCGITKAKFVKKSQTGGAIVDKPYCGLKKVPKGKKRGNRGECIDLGQIRYYGLEQVPMSAIETIKKTNKKQKES